MDAAPFFPKRIAIGTALLAMFIAFVAGRSISHGTPDWALVLTASLIGSLLIIKWAAPRIPLYQLGICGVVIIALHMTASYMEWPPGFVIAAHAASSVSRGERLGKQDLIHSQIQRARTRTAWYEISHNVYRFVIRRMS